MRSAHVVLLVLFSVPSFAQDRPLPDAQAFIQETRTRLESDELRQSDYVYTETRRELKLDKSGRTTRETVKVFESYPGLPGEPRWNRLISEDGKPVPPAELEKQDRERQKKVQGYVNGQAKAGGREKAERERQKRLRDDREAVDDAFRVYEVQMLGRERLDGHDTIVFSLTPRADAKPRTREGKVLKHFAGKVWVSETDYELVRLEAQALDTVSFGLGLLARVHKGSRAAFERRKVNGEEWLPAVAEFTASARVMLVRRLRVGGTSAFSNYRKFTVATDTAYGKPK